MQCTAIKHFYFASANTFKSVVKMYPWMKFHIFFIVTKCHQATVKNTIKIQLVSLQVEVSKFLNLKFLTKILNCHSKQNYQQSRLTHTSSPNPWHKINRAVAYSKFGIPPFLREFHAQMPFLPSTSFLLDNILANKEK